MGGVQKGCLIGGLGCGGLVVLVIIIVAIAAAASSGSGGGSSAGSSGDGGSTGAASGSSAVSTPGPGQPAKDGDFAFVVTGRYCGRKAEREVYNDPAFTGRMPAGTRECIIKMTVTDDKGTAQTFFDSNQYAYGAAGHQFSADQNGVYLTGDKDDTQVNPGVTITALVPYNIPASDSITRMVLHDSELSFGVTVRV
jgi:hypothetical protein